MAGDRLGFGSYVGFGVKLASGSTKGGHAATDVKFWMRVDEGFDDITTQRDRLQFQDMFSEDEVAAHVKPGQRKVDGTLSLKLTYDGLQDLLRFFTGHNVAVSGAGPFTYAFVPVAYNNAAHCWAGTTERLMTIEVHRGGVTNSTYYYGCVLSSLQIAFEGNARVTAVLGVKGRGFKVGTANAPVFNTDPMVTPTGQATALFQLQSVGYSCNKAQISIDTGLDFNFDVSQIETSLPVIAKKRSVKINAELRVPDDQTWLDRLDNPDAALADDVIITLDNGAAAGALRQLIFTFPNCKTDSPAEPRVRSIGAVTLALQMTGMSSTGAVPAYSVTLKNGVTNYVQNPLP